MASNLADPLHETRPRYRRMRDQLINCAAAQQRFCVFNPQGHSRLRALLLYIPCCFSAALPHRCLMLELVAEAMQYLLHIYAAGHVGSTSLCSVVHLC